MVAARSLQIGMLAEKVRDLGLDRLGQQSTRPIAQDFGELIVDVSWLNQLDDVIFGHGISLLRWRSGGVKHPHDMPPFRFPPSPTFSDSSEHIAASLNRMGLPTGQGKTWTAHRVSSVRRVRGIHAYRSAEKDGEWLTLIEAARLCGVTSHRI